MYLPAELFAIHVLLTLLRVAYCHQHIVKLPTEQREGLMSDDVHLGRTNEWIHTKRILLSEGRKMAEGLWNDPGRRACPCSNQSWCDIIRQVPKHELFIFSVRNTNWRRYDWNKITTIVTFNYCDDEVMCYAHSRGIKVVHGADFPKDLLTNATARSLWVNSSISKMLYNFWDGINVDFEQGINNSETAQRQGLTMLMKELNTAAKSVSPYTQITFDFASTSDAHYRRYDYKAIADVSDFAFVMDYDEDGGTYASANSPYDKTKHGMERFLALGIPSNKLILGAPWYGYWYWCDTYDKVSHKCKSKGFGQIQYYQVLRDKDTYSFTGRLWDSVAKSPYFAVKDPITGAIYEIWYDDPESLSIKFSLVHVMNLRGAGNWHADALNYTDPEQIKAMWNAFPSY